MKLLSFIKSELTLSISFVLTLISCFFVFPDKEYLGYINIEVLIVLFVLMGVTSGLKRSSFFSYIATKLTSLSHTHRSCELFLVLLTFFTSMFVTNDVALLIYVPFSLSLVRDNFDKKEVAILIVLETIAANLGSMATPFGNPQNLYIFSYFSLNAASFFKAILPYSALSFLLLLLIVFFKGSNKEISKKEEKREVNTGIVTLDFIVFAFALLTIFGLFRHIYLLLIALVLFLLFDRVALKEIDYALLLTFICFFIFSGNLARIESVREILVKATEKYAFITSLLASQLISNVPSAVLLSPFTLDWRAILLGTDIGGLGTPIASLASLISLKFIYKEKGINKGGYLLLFTLLNLLFLFALLVLYFLTRSLSMSSF